MTPLLTPVGLRCGHQDDPLGIAPDRVRLSWTLHGPGTGRAQRAYQVLVARDGERLAEEGDLSWDSGRVESASSGDIPYAGKALIKGGRYTWQVRVWDDQGLVSGWSGPATFEVELDSAGGWLASWISQGQVRRSVTPPAGAGRSTRSRPPCPPLPISAGPSRWTGRRRPPGCT